MFRRIDYISRSFIEIYLYRKVSCSYFDRIDPARLEIVAVGIRSVDPSTPRHYEHYDNRRE